MDYGNWSNGTNCTSFTEYRASPSRSTDLNLSVSILTFILGISGNLTLIYLIRKTERRLSNPSLFILNMSIGDMIFLLIYVPSDCSVHLSSQWHGGTPTCKIIYFIRYLTLGVSIFTLMALSMDRYFAIVRPLNMNNNRRRVFGVITFVWFLSASLASLPAFGARQLKFEDQRACVVVRVCQINVSYYPLFPTVLLWFKFVTYFFLPLFIIVYFYGAMAMVLCRPAEFFDGTNQPHRSNGNGSANIMTTTTAHSGVSAIPQHRVCSTRRNANRRKLARTVLCLVAMFVICWFPGYAYSFYFYIRGEVSMTFKQIANQLTFVYSCVNPITLFVLSKRFRRALRHYCFHCAEEEPRNLYWTDTAFSRRTGHGAQSTTTRPQAGWRYGRQGSEVTTEAIPMKNQEASCNS